MVKRKRPATGYGNWVPAKVIRSVGIISLGWLIITVIALYYFKLILCLPVILVFLFFFITFFYFRYAHTLFSEKGGDIQNKVYNLIFDFLGSEVKGKILDIGCGNGKLLIRLAQKYPDCQFHGMDYWDGVWDYSWESCINNAKEEGVDERITFRQASASSLPYDENSFDLVLSNLVFHEVKDSKNKRELVKEALRVLKPGGRFVFQDLFQIRSIYGDIDDFLKEVGSWGIKDVRFADTSKSPFIPKVLRLSFMLGGLGVIEGNK